MKKYFLIIGVLSVLLVAGYGVYLRAPDAVVKDTRPSIVASFYPLYYLASEIVGSQMLVENITQGGQEPHDYEPTPRDRVRLEEALLIVLGGFEPWLPMIKDDPALAPKVFVMVAGSEVDPHVWLSPRALRSVAERLSERIISLDPEHAGLYQANTQRLLAQLEALDRNYTQGLVHCDSKDIVSSHAAFGYLARDYGLSVLPIAGMSPEDEPSAKALADIATTARARGVKAVFYEGGGNAELAQTLAREISVATLPLYTLETLTSSQMQAGENYLSLMTQNLHTLQQGLACHPQP